MKTWTCEESLPIYRKSCLVACLAVVVVNIVSEYLFWYNFAVLVLISLSLAACGLYTMASVHKFYSFLLWSGQLLKIGLSRQCSGILSTYLKRKLPCLHNSPGGCLQSSTVAL